MSAINSPVDYASAPTLGDALVAPWASPSMSTAPPLLSAFGIQENVSPLPEGPLTLILRKRVCLVPRYKAGWCYPFLISIFCCLLATSSGFGRWIRNTPLSNLASTFAGSGSNGRGIARLNEP